MHRDDTTVEKSATGAREIDRRTIAKGAAWTVPVVIVATAAPAAAASPTPITVTITGTGKLGSGSGNKAVSFQLTVQSSGAGQIRFTLVDGYAGQNLPKVQTLAQGANSVSFTTDRKSAAATTSVLLTYSVDGGVTNPTVSIPVS